MGPAALATPGRLDASFGGDGKITTNFTTGNDEAVATVVQADGKIVAGGSAAGLGLRFALARYNPNGSLDTSFGAGGKVLTNFAAGPDWINWLDIDANGKIVAVGGSGPASGADFRFALARYNDDGTLDTTFSGDGKLTTNLTTGYDYAEAVDIQLDGKIVVAGGAGGSGGRFAVVRYNDDGTPDIGFGPNGARFVNFTAGLDTAWAMALDQTERIVAVGRAAGEFAVARLNTDGTVDATFDGDGKVTTDFTTQVDFALELAIDGSNKIVAAGFAARNGDRFALARYNDDGSLDTTFSGNGKVITDFNTGSDVATGVGIQADGKIVAVGWSGPARSSDYRFALARYWPAGHLDTSFGGDGKITTDFTTGTDFAWGMAIADDKIVAVGRAGGTGGRFALARYLTV